MKTMLLGGLVIGGWVGASTHFAGFTTLTAVDMVIPLALIWYIIWRNYLAGWVP